MEEEKEERRKELELERRRDIDAVTVFEKAQCAEH